MFVVLSRGQLLLWAGFFVAGIGIMILCGSMSVEGQDGPLARPPRAISLRELAANGPGDNPHVIVTDFFLGEKYGWEARGRPGAGAAAAGMVRGWIPLFPGPAGPEPTRFNLLLETPETRGSAATLVANSRRASYQATVRPLAATDISDQAMGQLMAAYPDTNPVEVFVLQQVDPRKAEDARTAVYGIIGGAVMAIVGVALFGLGIYLLVREERDGSAYVGRRKAPSRSDEGHDEEVLSLDEVGAVAIDSDEELEPRGRGRDGARTPEPLIGGLTRHWGVWAALAAFVAVWVWVIALLVAMPDPKMDVPARIAQGGGAGALISIAAAALLGLLFEILQVVWTWAFSSREDEESADPRWVGPTCIGLLILVPAVAGLVGFITDPLNAALGLTLGLCVGVPLALIVAFFVRLIARSM